MSLTTTTTTTMMMMMIILVVVEVVVPSNILRHALGATLGAAALGESPLEAPAPPAHMRDARARRCIKDGHAARGLEDSIGARAAAH